MRFDASAFDADSNQVFDVAVRGAERPIDLRRPEIDAHTFAPTKIENANRPRLSPVAAVDRARGLSLSARTWNTITIVHSGPEHLDPDSSDQEVDNRICAAALELAAHRNCCSYRFPAHGRLSQVQWGPVVDVAEKLAIVGGENDRGVGRGQCLGEFVDEGN